MTRSELLLAILAAAGGQAYTPVQLQKSVFLIDRNISRIVDEGPTFNFAPYDYGPFDAGVYTTAELLRDQNDAVIAPSAAGRWKTYSASPEGLMRGQEILRQMPPDQAKYVSSVSEWVRSLSFTSLVKSIYDAYPDTKANSIFVG